VTCVSVLDISSAALIRAQNRLGTDAKLINWIEADVTGDWPVPPVDVWHDRAVFHFLTDPADRARYVERLKTAVRPGGSVIIATFGPDGPAKCSGLDVVRYSPELLARELAGAGLQLQESVAEQHHTPVGTTQAFVYCRFVRTEINGVMPGSGAPRSS
jgi:SAM-dependent methyltransferase